MTSEMMGIYEISKKTVGRQVSDRFSFVLSGTWQKIMPAVFLYALKPESLSSQQAYPSNSRLSLLHSSKFWYLETILREEIEVEK